jgi:tartrate-resistant acid phosphatase type 5
VSGVSSSADPQFKEIFEEVYSASQLKNTPWFHTLGNHDYLDNYQAQTDYMALSKRWYITLFIIFISCI